MPVRPNPFVAARILIPVVSLSMYAGAFAAPAGSNNWHGYQLFLLGLIYCWMVQVTFSWWANPGYWIALGYYLRGEHVLAARWGSGATGLALTWALPDPGTFRAPAFLLWTGSMAALALGARALDRWPRPSGATPEDREDPGSIRGPGAWSALHLSPDVRRRDLPSA